MTCLLLRGRQDRDDQGELSLFHCSRLITECLDFKWYVVLIVWLVSGSGKRRGLGLKHPFFSATHLAQWSLV